MSGQPGNESPGDNAASAAGSSYEVKVPDVGEGVAEVELVSWQVEIGQTIRRREMVAEVMTDKATVEVPSPVDGTIASLGGTVGDVLAVGSVLFVLHVDGAVGTVSPPTPPVVVAPDPPAGVDGRPHTTGETPAADRPALPRTEPSARSASAHHVDRPDRPRSTPAVRRRAREAGVDMRTVVGTGPSGRITHEDLDGYLAAPRSSGSSGGTLRGAGLTKRTEITEQPIIGLRRKIAQRMVHAVSTIPHITYVEEVDVTDLERLRASLNQSVGDSSARLTMLPFLIRAIVNAVPAFPMINAHVLESDDGTDTLTLFAPVHMGIATQTDTGLIVPVLRHVEADTIWTVAKRIAELADATRTGHASAGDLSGSTITISSLGRLGGLVSTPVINKPETTVVGVNKIATRPVWNADVGGFEPRQIMNLSSSFDHRVVDGFDAASFIQAIKASLEQPALLFVDEHPTEGRPS